jgi:hypothetical protein
MTQAADDRNEPLDDYELRLAQNAALGEEIKDARDRAGFILLFGEAKRKAIRARTDLVDANPEDAKEIRRLQNDVRRYEEMAHWVRTAIVQGEQCFQQLQTHRGEHVPDDGELSPD